MKPPQISFVLPAYKARFLADAIKSILSQSFTDFELVIVDDCSPEDLKIIVDTFDDERITYQRNLKNIGGKNLVEQWTFCISLAKGEFIILAADDDVYHPDFLMQCVDLSKKHPNVDIIRARVATIDEKNQLIGIDGLLPEILSKNGFLYYWLRGTVTTCIGNYLFRRTSLVEKGFVEFPSAFCSDAATAIALSEFGIASTEDMLFSFRISTIHLSSNRTQLERKLLANTLFYKWLLNLNYEAPTSSLEHFFFDENNAQYISAKCSYDYYNQVIKFLPLHKVGFILRCELASTKSKAVMFARYFMDKILKR